MAPVPPSACTQNTLSSLIASLLFPQSLSHTLLGQEKGTNESGPRMSLGAERVKEGTPSMGWYSLFSPASNNCLSTFASCQSRAVERKREERGDTLWTVGRTRGLPSSVR